MSSHVHPTLFLPIECDIDIEVREARVKIGELLQSSGRPIRSPVTGDAHRVRINIPDGIEFEMAEIASASTTATGNIKLDLKDSYGQFNLLRHSGRGMVHWQPTDPPARQPTNRPLAALSPPPCSLSRGVREADIHSKAALVAQSPGNRS